MVPYRSHADPSVSPLNFEALVANSVRQIRETAVGLTTTESKHLHDVSRGRYLRGVRRVAEIARQRCTDPSDAAAFADAIRGFILFGHPGVTLSVYDAFRVEQLSNERGNLAQFEYLIAPSRATKERVIEFLHAQELASRACVDAMWRDMGRPPRSPASAIAAVA